MDYLCMLNVFERQANYSNRLKEIGRVAAASSSNSSSPAHVVASPPPALPELSIAHINQQNISLNRDQRKRSDFKVSADKRNDCNDVIIISSKHSNNNISNSLENLGTIETPTSSNSAASSVASSSPKSSPGCRPHNATPLKSSLGANNNLTVTASMPSPSASSSSSASSLCVPASASSPRPTASVSVASISPSLTKRQHFDGLISNNAQELRRHHNLASLAAAAAAQSAAMAALRLQHLHHQQDEQHALELKIQRELQHQHHAARKLTIKENNKNRVQQQQQQQQQIYHSHHQHHQHQPQHHHHHSSMHHQLQQQSANNSSVANSLLWQPWRDFQQAAAIHQHLYEQQFKKEARLTSKELPTTAWRRDRRMRASEYHISSVSPPTGSTTASSSNSSSMLGSSGTSSTSRLSASPPSSLQRLPYSLHPVPHDIALTMGVTPTTTAPTLPVYIAQQHHAHQQHVHALHLQQQQHKLLQLQQQEQQQSLDSPLDMSLSSAKQRTSPPPPYREPLPGSNYATSLARPSVITQAPSKRGEARDSHLILNRENDNRSNESISMCDNVIEEHFRRSLGPDYVAIFGKKSPTPCSSANTPSPQPQAAHQQVYHSFGGASSTSASPPPMPMPLTTAQTTSNATVAHKNNSPLSAAIAAPPPPAYHQAMAASALLSPAGIAVVAAHLQSAVAAAAAAGSPLPPPQQQALPLHRSQSPPSDSLPSSPQPQLNSNSNGPTALRGSGLIGRKRNANSSPASPSQANSPTVLSTKSCALELRQQQLSPAPSPDHTPPVTAPLNTTSAGAAINGSPLNDEISVSNASARSKVPEPLHGGFNSIPLASLAAATSTNSSNATTPPPSPASSSNASLTPNNSDVMASVDDHFAKALGETWKKLQEHGHKK